MGQNNSKDTAPSSQGDKSIYPIGGGHVGEGPFFNNPVAAKPQELAGEPRGAQLVTQSPQSQAGAGSLDVGNSSQPSKYSTGKTITNPIYEAEQGAESSSAPVSEAHQASVQQSGQSIKDSNAGNATQAASEVYEDPAYESSADLHRSKGTASPAKGSPQAEAPVAPRTPENVPPSTKLRNAPSNSTPDQAKLDHDASTAIGGSSAPIEPVTSSNSHPGLSTGKELDSSAPENMAAAPYTISQESSSAQTGDDPASAWAARKADVAAGLAKKEVESGHHVDTRQQELTEQRTANTSASTAPAPAASPSSGETPGSGSHAAAAAPAVIAAIPTASLPATKTAVPTARKASPRLQTQDQPSQGQRLAQPKLGVTGNLVPQEEKVGGGCLCFAPPPNSKKADGQRQTVATDAPMYVGPAPAGALYPIGGGVIHRPEADKVEARRQTEPAPIAAPTSPPEKISASSDDSAMSEEIVPVEPEPNELVARDPKPGAVPTPVAVSAKDESKKVVPAGTSATEQRAAIPYEEEEQDQVQLKQPTGSGVGSQEVSYPASTTHDHSLLSANIDPQKTLSQDEVVHLPPVKDSASFTPISPPAAQALEVDPAQGRPQRESRLQDDFPYEQPGPSEYETDPVLPGSGGTREAEPTLEASRGVAVSEASPAGLTENVRKKPVRSVSFKDESPASRAALASEVQPFEERTVLDPIIGSSQTGSNLNSTMSGNESDPGMERANKATTPDLLSSTEITEMPGIGRSIPHTPDREAGSVLTDGHEAHTLTQPERGAVHMESKDSGPMSPLTRLQVAHEAAEEGETPDEDERSTQQVFAEPMAVAPAAGVAVPDSTTRSPVTDQGAADSATGSALSAGAAAGSANASLANQGASKKSQLSAGSSRKMEKAAAKKEAEARALSLKEKEKQDKANFKAKRQEERERKKTQQKRLKEEMELTKKGKSSGGLFGLISKPAKKDDRPSHAQPVGGAAANAGPMRPGAGAAGAGLSGPANAVGTTGVSGKHLGSNAGTEAIEGKSSHYLASQGMPDEGSSHKIGQDTPKVISIKDMPEQNAETDTLPTSGGASSSHPSAASTTHPKATPTAETGSAAVGYDGLEEPTGPRPTSQIAEPVPSTLLQPVNVVFDDEDPIEEREILPSTSEAVKPLHTASEAPLTIVDPPLTPPQTERAMPIVATESSPDAEILPVSEPSPPIHETPPVAKKKSRKLMTRVKQPKRPKKPKVKVDKNIDFSARLLSQATDAQLSQGYNPSTRQFDTSKGLRVPAGAYTPLRSGEPLVAQTSKEVYQESVERKRSKPSGETFVPQLVIHAPPGRGIMTPAASMNKADYRPMSRSFHTQ